MRTLITSVVGVVAALTTLIITAAIAVKRASKSMGGFRWGERGERGEDNE